MDSILITNGHLIDPANGVDGPADLLLEAGQVVAVGRITQPAAVTIDARNLIVMPGLIDLQVHMREPGREDKETIASAARAALAGGVTCFVAMPNSDPVADDQTVIEFIIKRARELDLCHVLPTGTITRHRAGRGLADMQELKNSGAVAVTDDGSDVQDEGLLRRAFEYARTCDLLLMSHCECRRLTDAGVMHEGWVATQLGLPGVPAEAEDLAVMKNILLGRRAGARLHLLHNSTAGAVAAIRAAKADGYALLSAEASAQHFALTDEECLGYNTNAKMYPPLRSAEHLAAVIAGLKDGTIDAISTDHAPHTEPDKLEPFTHAAFGSTGLETSLAVMYSYLVAPGHLSLSAGVAAMTANPARILRRRAGALGVGMPADLTLFDPGARWVVDPGLSHSKGRNCVFAGKELSGRVVATLVGGRVRYREGSFLT